MNGIVAGEIQGLPVSWLLSLAEAQYVLYVAVSGEDRLLFWENARLSPAAIAGVVRLSPKHRQQWQQQLEVLLHDPLPPVNGHRQTSSNIAELAAHAEALK